MLAARATTLPNYPIWSCNLSIVASGYSKLHAKSLCVFHVEMHAMQRSYLRQLLDFLARLDRETRHQLENWAQSTSSHS